LGGKAQVQGADRPVVVIASTPARPVAVDVVTRHLGTLATIRTLDFPDREHSPTEEAAIVSQLADARGIFMRTGYINARMLGALPNLQVIALHGAGLNQVDLVAASQHGVLVTNAPGGNSIAVAEYTFGLLLALLRRIARGDRLVRSGQWDSAIFNGRQLHSRVLGIVGLGYIGTLVAKMGRGFSMNLIGWDPYVSEDKFNAVMVARRELDQLLKEADIVTLHLPLMDTTRNLLSDRELGLMKDGAILVNAARGQLVDENALVRTLSSGHLGGAALDAFAEEPLPTTSPLLKFDNVIVSPHMAGVAQEVLAPIAEMAAADIASVLLGRMPRFMANSELLNQYASSTPPRDPSISGSSSSGKSSQLLPNSTRDDKRSDG
jgi:D-3-phosphoglycerate dehydrogenase / 2-oxoglutarate reductase